MTTTREDRKKAVKRVLANSALEGLEPSPEFLDLLTQYVAGEISLESALEYTKAKYPQIPDPAPPKMSQ
jgi:hypothetical protein